MTKHKFMVRQRDLPEMRRPSPLVPVRVRLRNRVRQRPTPRVPLRVQLQNRAARNRRRNRSRALPRYMVQTTQAQGFPHVSRLTINRAGGPNADPIAIQTLVVDLILREITNEVLTIRNWSRQVIEERVTGITKLIQEL